MVKPTTSSLIYILCLFFCVSCLLVACQDKKRDEAQKQAEQAQKQAQEQKKKAEEAQKKAEQAAQEAKKAIEQKSTWQSYFFVAIIIAIILLILGTALGSKARKDAQSQQNKDTPSQQK